MLIKLWLPLICQIVVTVQKFQNRTANMLELLNQIHKEIPFRTLLIMEANHSFCWSADMANSWQQQPLIILHNLEAKQQSSENASYKVQHFKALHNSKMLAYLCFGKGNVTRQKQQQQL